MLVEAAQGQFNVIKHLFCQSCAVHSLPAQIWCSQASHSGMCELNTASDMIPATTWSPSHPPLITAVLGALSSTFQSIHLLHADPAMCDIKTLLSCSLFSPSETCIGRKQRTSGCTHLPKANFWLKWYFCVFTGALTEHRNPWLCPKKVPVSRNNQWFLSNQTTAKMRNLLNLWYSNEENGSAPSLIFVLHRIHKTAARGELDLEGKLYLVYFTQLLTQAGLEWVK